MEEAYLGERGASRRGHALVLVGGSVEGRGRQAHGRSPRKEGRARSSPRRLVGALVRAAPPRNSQTPLPPSSRPAISRGSRWALTGGAPTSSHARGQCSEPPWSPPQNSGCGPRVLPPHRVALLECHGPAPVRPRVLAAALCSQDRLIAVLWGAGRQSQGGDGGGDRRGRSWVQDEEPPPRASPGGRGVLLVTGRGGPELELAPPAQPGHAAATSALQPCSP